MTKISEILDKIKSSDYFTALFLLIKNMFSFTKTIDRVKFYWSVAWLVLFSAIACSIHGDLSSLLWLAITIMTASLLIRRVNDTGTKWYISVLPLIFLIMSFATLVVITITNLGKISSSLNVNNVRLVGNFIDRTAVNLIIATIIFVMVFLAVLIYIVTQKKDKLKDSTVVKVIYVTVSLLACLLFTATFSVFFTNITKPIEQGEYNKQAITKTIAVNGVFNSGIDSENPDAVISYYETNKSQFEDNFKKFAVEENKIADDVYCLPILSQNVTDNNNVYPLIEIGVLNTSKEVKEITIEDCSINGNYTILNAKQKLDPGVNFIPIKLNEANKLNGDEVFQATLNGSVRAYSILYSIEKYDN